MSNYTDEKKLLSDPEYRKQWVETELKKASEWFMKQIGINGT